MDVSHIINKISPKISIVFKKHQEFLSVLDTLSFFLKREILKKDLEFKNETYIINNLSTNEKVYLSVKKDILSSLLEQKIGKSINIKF